MTTAGVPADDTDTAEPEAKRGRVRRVAAVVTTVLACLLVLFALVGPEALSQLSPWAFLRIPIEALIGLAILVVLPPTARKVVGWILGVVLGVLTVVKILDMGFQATLGTPFDPLSGWAFLGPGLDFLNGAIGHVGAIVVAVLAAVLTVAIVVLVALAVLRLTRLAAGHRVGSLRAAGALGVVWVVLAVTGVQVAQGEPLAARGAATLAYDNVRQVGVDIRDQRQFADQLTHDPYATTPAGQLLGGLRGKDVLLVFVESYGQVSLHDPQVTDVLKSGTAQLKAAGFDARTGFLTSSTTGGGSWLAHSTLESGLWINNEQRYNTFTDSNRATLTSLFRRAGWQTFADIPENTEDWPQGDVYRFGKLYDSRNVGYQGPGFAYSNMPDQYTMAAFQRLVRANPNHQPLMAEIDLTSSHSPWTHQPRLVNWNAVGNGSIFDPMPSQGKSFGEVWPDPVKIRQAYGQSIKYSVSTLIQYLQHYGDKNTVMVFLGDHQPQEPVVSPNHTRNVPITIVAKDPTVLNKIASWHWTEGLMPAQNAPVWRMDQFRDKFLATFSTSKS